MESDNPETLILFTNSFPFGSSESFLESEIPFLAESFKYISIIPLKGGSACRQMPDNVDIVNPLLSSNIFSRIFRGLINKAPVVEILKSFQFEKSFNGVKKAIIALLDTRTILTHRDVENTIRKKPRALLYFYWGAGAANIIPFLKVSHQIFVRFHGYDLYEERNDACLVSRTRLLSRVTRGFTVSSHGQRYLINKYPSFAAKIQVCRLGVTEGRTLPIAASNKEFFKIVTCSNLIPLKRVHLVVEALKILKMKICWTHIGSGPLASDIEYKSRSLPKNIECHFTGQLKNSEVRRYYECNAVDLFINVSSTEGVPVSVMEALSFGIPVIATDVGGTSELLTDSRFLLPRDIGAVQLANKIMEILASPHMREAEIFKSMWRKKANSTSVYPEFIGKLRSNFFVSDPASTPSQAGQHPI